MSKIVTDHAFVLAAGLGTRLRPHTDTLPKPLVPVNGKPLLGYIFDHLKTAGVHKVTVNLHHKAEKLREYIKTRPDMIITESYESELLDTGGGAKKALPSLGPNPFFMINGDAFWLDGENELALNRLKQSFNPKTTDILLLLQPVSTMQLTEGVGDYNMREDGNISRSLDKTGTHMFTGIRLCDPATFRNIAEDKFSFMALMDKSQSEGRLRGIVHDGAWHHISTPQDLAAVDAAMRG